MATGNWQLATAEPNGQRPDPTPVAQPLPLPLPRRYQNVLAEGETFPVASCQLPFATPLRRYPNVLAEGETFPVASCQFPVATPLRKETYEVR